VSKALVDVSLKATECPLTDVAAPLPPVRRRAPPAHAIELSASLIGLPSPGEQGDSISCTCRCRIVSPAAATSAGLEFLMATHTPARSLPYRRKPMNDRVSVAGSHVPVVFLSEQDRLRIRLGAVSVDSIPGGGG
jgi:hypothetical protein